MTKTSASARQAYEELFWESLKDVPALRCQLIEIVEAGSISQLTREWGFTHHEQCVRYIKGPLKRRLNRVGGGRAVGFLRRIMASKGVIE